MSDLASTAQRQQQKQQGVLITLLTLPFRFVAVLLGSLLLSILIECIGMYILWPEEGWRHSQQMFEFELGQLSNNFKRSALVKEPERMAKELIQIVHHAIIAKTGFEGAVHNTSRKVHSFRTEQARKARDYVTTFYTHLESNLIAAAYAVLVFITRLVVLFLSLPLFVIAAFLGLIDGLVSRDIRRFGAGRESSYLYHRAKACVMPLATLPWVIYLTIPLSVEASLILVPSAACLAIALGITVSSFKKYL